MSDSERVDLSPLDPERDPERWARLVATTRLRVEAVLDQTAGTPGPLELVGLWLRPIVVAAAMLTALLGGAWLALDDRSAALADASEARRLAALSDESLGRGVRPTGAQLLVALRSRSAP
ncbi:MAG TPA: hypothetical protein VHG35_13785 [Gemmatimonadales bacterium]|nr:hypothetical protein [Gemmatimonadales bacterium]